MSPEDIKKIIQEKVVGIWEARHTSSMHKYCHLPSGTLVDSVTTQLGILSKPHLFKWGIKIAIEWLLVDDRLERLKYPQWRDELMQGAMLAPTDHRDEHGQVGTFSHSILERYCNEFIDTGKRPESIMKFVDINKDDPRSIAAARAGEELMIKNNVIPIASELICGDPKYSAGQLDLLCLWKGTDLCLLDWKSSNNVSQDYILQTVAYAKFWKFMTGINIKKIKIAHLSKESNKYTVYNVKNIGKSYIAFKQICGVYKWRVDKKNILVKDIKRLKI